MIKNKWYVVLDSKEVKKKPLGVKRLGEKMVFWRDSQGQVVCQIDKCCHRGAQLSIGKVVGDCIQCPFHGFLFDQKGQCTLVPANGKTAKIPKSFKVKTYPIQEKHGWIWLYWGEATEGQKLPELPFFDDIDDDFRYSTLQSEWPVHYTRAVENQLDMMHLAFTHKRTIGFGNRCVIDGPPVEWIDEDTIRCYASARKENGVPAKKAREIGEIDIEDMDVHIEFRFPNIWQNYIHEKMRVFAAFVPVDENTSITYVRNYQKFVTLPILGHLVDGINYLLSQVIIREDKAHVITQQPNYSEYGMDELLIAGDRPIVEFRRRRHELLQEQKEATLEYQSILQTLKQKQDYTKAEEALEESIYHKTKDKAA